MNVADMHPVTQLCTSQTGVTEHDVEHRAATRWENRRGTRPPWDELHEHERQDLILTTAIEWISEFTDPVPDARREPVDHDHVLSPPHPAGADELAYWTRWVQTDLDKAIEMARWIGTFVTVQPGDTQCAFERTAPLTPGIVGPDHIAGHIDARLELLQLLAETNEPTGTGRDALADLIDRYSAHVDRYGDVDDTLLATWAGGDYPRSKRDEARTWLNRLRWRQRNLATPAQWKRGGRALVAALYAVGAVPDPEPGEQIPDDLVIIAVHEGSRAGFGYRDDVRTLHELTGQPREVCELAIRRAVDRELVTLIGGPREAYLTDSATVRYIRLVAAVQPPQTG